MYTRPLNEILEDLRGIQEGIADKELSKTLKKHIVELERVEKIVALKGGKLDYSKPVRKPSTKKREPSEYNIFVKKAFADAKKSGEVINFADVGEMWRKHKSE